MKVTSDHARHVDITLHLTIEEVRQIYDATRIGRRTKAEQRVLLDLGDALVAACPRAFETGPGEQVPTRKAPARRRRAPRPTVAEAEFAAGFELPVVDNESAVA